MKNHHYLTIQGGEGVSCVWTTTTACNQGRIARVGPIRPKDRQEDLHLVKGDEFPGLDDALRPFPPSHEELRRRPEGLCDGVDLIAEALQREGA